MAAEGEAGGVQEYKNLFGARVHFPVDMPDAMLKHAIESARKNLASCDDWQAKVRGPCYAHECVTCLHIYYVTV